MEPCRADREWINDLGSRGGFCLIVRSPRGRGRFLVCGRIGRAGTAAVVPTGALVVGDRWRCRSRRPVPIGGEPPWSGLGACGATLVYCIVQILQIVGVLVFPLDEILIYGTSLCIVVPFILEMLAFHHSTGRERQFWTHAALIFTVIYAVFVTANYVVQLATVIPARVQGEAEAIGLLVQTPHSMFWNYDAIGYIAMGIATLLALPALSNDGFERWVKISFMATPL